MMAEPRREHAWLQRLVGEWESEMEAPAEPGKPAQTIRGTETIRPLGGLWVVAESDSEMPGMGPWKSMMTIGFNPRRDSYVGTFVDTMMNHMWVYQGSLDEERQRLTLEAEGPVMDDQGNPDPEGGTTMYRDVTEMVSDDERTLTSHIQRGGEWVPMMQVRYRRTQSS
jgi:hypothetical protein